MALRYLKKKDGCFSQVKPSEAQKTLKLLSDDLLFLVEKFRDHKELSIGTLCALIRSAELTVDEFIELM